MKKLLFRERTLSNAIIAERSRTLSRDILGKGDVHRLRAGRLPRLAGCRRAVIHV
jgi:hypothetical protein